LTLIETLNHKTEKLAIVRNNFRLLTCYFVISNLIDLSFYFLETKAEFWKQVGDDELKKAIEAEKFNRNVAKNVIIFLGRLHWKRHNTSTRALAEKFPEGGERNGKNKTEK